MAKKTETSWFGGAAPVKKAAPKTAKPKAAPVAKPTAAIPATPEKKRADTKALLEAAKPSVPSGGVRFKNPKFVNELNSAPPTSLPEDINESRYPNMVIGDTRSHDHLHSVANELQDRLVSQSITDSALNRKVDKRTQDSLDKFGSHITKAKYALGIHMQYHLAGEHNESLPWLKKAADHLHDASNVLREKYTKKGLFKDDSEDPTQTKLGGDLAARLEDSVKDYRLKVEGEGKTVRNADAFTPSYSRGTPSDSFVSFKTPEPKGPLKANVAPSAAKTAAEQAGKKRGASARAWEGAGVGPAVLRRTIRTHWDANNVGQDFTKSDAFHNPQKYAEDNNIAYPHHVVAKELGLPATNLGKGKNTVEDAAVEEQATRGGDAWEAKPEDDQFATAMPERPTSVEDRYNVFHMATGEGKR